MENYVVIVIEGATTVQAIDGEYDLADALSLAHELCEARTGQTAGYRRAEIRNPYTEKAWQLYDVPYA